MPSKAKRNDMQAIPDNRFEASLCNNSLCVSHLSKYTSTAARAPSWSFPMLIHSQNIDKTTSIWGNKPICTQEYLHKSAMYVCLYASILAFTVNKNEQMLTVHLSALTIEGFLCGPFSAAPHHCNKQLIEGPTKGSDLKPWPEFYSKFRIRIVQKPMFFCSFMYHDPRLQSPPFDWKRHVFDRRESLLWLNLIPWYLCRMFMQFRQSLRKLNVCLGTSSLVHQ